MEIHRRHIQNHNSGKNQKVERNLNDPFRYVPDDYKKVAQGLEQQFAEYMLKQMHNSIGRQDEDGTAMNYYQDLNQKEQAKIMSEINNGLGIQKLIIDEIYPEKFRNPEALAAYDQQKAAGQIKKKQIEMMGPPSELKPTMNKSGSIQIGREASDE